MFRVSPNKVYLSLMLRWAVGQLCAQNAWACSEFSSEREPHATMPKNQLANTTPPSPHSGGDLGFRVYVTPAQGAQHLLGPQGLSGGPTFVKSARGMGHVAEEN